MKEPIPQARTETVRQAIIKLLDGQVLPVGAISKEVGKSEKEISDHLDQIGRSGLLTIIPPKCADCGFVFKDRTRIKKPGKCPLCRSTRIRHPMFTIKVPPA
ncbi:MAG: ArsR family transcriptional regulator [Thermodesulfobacteriota bacterium]